MSSQAAQASILESLAVLLKEASAGNLEGFVAAYTLKDKPAGFIINLQSVNLMELLGSLKILEHTLVHSQQPEELYVKKIIGPRRGGIQ